MRLGEELTIEVTVPTVGDTSITFDPALVPMEPALYLSARPRNRRPCYLCRVRFRKSARRRPALRSHAQARWRRRRGLESSIIFPMPTRGNRPIRKRHPEFQRRSPLLQKLAKYRIVAQIITSRLSDVRHADDPIGCGARQRLLPR